MGTVCMVYLRLNLRVNMRLPHFRKGCWFWCYLMPLHRPMAFCVRMGFWSLALPHSRCRSWQCWILHVHVAPFGNLQAIFVSMHEFLGDFLQHFPVAFGSTESATQRVDQHWQVSRRIARCSRRCRQGPTQPMGSDECHIGWFVPCSYRLLALVVSVCNH